jgi:beta-lactamase class A
MISYRRSLLAACLAVVAGATALAVTLTTGYSDGVPAAGSSTPTAGTSAQPPASGTAAAPESISTGDGRQQRQEALTAALTAYDQSLPARFAVVVVDHTTEQTWGYQTQAVFETASIVKVDILAALLLQAQRNQRSLTAQERRLAERMIRYSDNDAASALWSSVGGADGVNAANAQFGLASTTPGDQGYWGLTTTTAADQARLIDATLAGNGPLTPASSAYLAGLMTSVTDDQGWGISAGAKDGEAVALKNGWLSRSNQNGRWIVNSIGRVTDADTDAIVVVLSTGNASFAAGVSSVEKVTKMTRQSLDW